MDAICNVLLRTMSTAVDCYTSEAVMFLLMFCSQCVITDAAVPISRLTELVTVTKDDMQQSGLFGNIFRLYLMASGLHS